MPQWQNQQTKVRSCALQLTVRSLNLRTPNEYAWVLDGCLQEALTLALLKHEGKECSVILVRTTPTLQLLRFASTDPSTSAAPVTCHSPLRVKTSLSLNLEAEERKRPHSALSCDSHDPVPHEQRCVHNCALTRTLAEGPC